MLKRLSSVVMAVSAAGLIAVAAMPLQAAMQADAAGSIRFNTPTMLGLGSWGAGGGEPSIVADGTGNLYVSAPQGVPAGAEGTRGIGFWISRDHGKTWADPANYGSGQGGGDSDVAIAPDDSKTLYLADLNATSNTICVSHDSGTTFADAQVAPAGQGAPDPTACSQVTSTAQYGYSSDRQWLTPDRNGVVYLTYHEFVSAQPLIFKDTHYGSDGFADGPCGSIIDVAHSPATEANMLNDLTAGSLVSKPVLDDAGNIYILITSPTQQQQAAALASNHTSPTISEAIIAVSKDHCATFSDYAIFDGSAVGTNTVQFGDDFNVLAIDGAGNLYAAAAGYIGETAYDKVAKIYFFSSTDKGQTWSAPVELDNDKSAHMLPAIVAGQHAGEVAIGYYRTINGATDPNDTKGQWTYSIAESTDGVSAHPHWSYLDLNSGYVYHPGDICNSGTLCGLPLPGVGVDRSLADFSSAALDNADCPAFVFAGNPTSNPPPPTHTVGGAGTGPGLKGSGKYATLPFVARQQEPCFKAGTAAAQSPAAVSSPSPVPTPSAAPAPAPSTAPIQHAPLPNTDLASFRALAMGSFIALFLLGLAARTLIGVRLER